MPIIAIPDTEACHETQQVLDLLRNLYKVDPYLLGALLAHHVEASPQGGAAEAVGAPLATHDDSGAAYLGTLGLLNAVLRACSHTQIGIVLDAKGGIGDFTALRVEP